METELEQPPEVVIQSKIWRKEGRIPETDTYWGLPGEQLRPSRSHRSMLVLWEKKRPHGGNAGVSRMCFVGEFEEMRRRVCEANRGKNQIIPESLRFSRKSFPRQANVSLQNYSSPNNPTRRHVRVRLAALPWSADRCPADCLARQSTKKRLGQLS